MNPQNIMAKKKPSNPAKTVETITHDEARRKNIPTAEYQSVVKQEQQRPVPVKYPRNPDLDPQLVWRGKDEQDWSDLVVHAPPLYIQEKVHPKVLIDDLLKQTAEEQSAADKVAGKKSQLDLFADFNGIPAEADKTDFYLHDQNWSNRMILGDSLHVMASLAEREGLRGKVQCIYFDPPYGIKFNSNFQWSTTSRDVKDGKADHITREPEQVKAFRDTWRDGVHSYLTTIRDRLTVARDLLTDSGSIFVQIGDENVHRVRALLDEVFGDENSITQLLVRTTAMGASDFIGGTVSFVLYYAKDKSKVKYRPLFVPSGLEEDTGNRYTRVQTSDYQRRVMNDLERAGDEDAIGKVKVYRHSPLSSQSGGAASQFEYEYEGISFRLGKGHWKTNVVGMDRLARSWRLGYPTRNSLSYVRFVDDFSVTPLGEFWSIQSGAFTEEKVYVVQTNKKVVDRCILMATDPGDLVLDPTCGSGTTAYVAEQWGRRWITIDTSRVAMALARARIMGARYPYYLLADSRDGQLKEAEVTRAAPSTQPTRDNIRLGFVYERVPHITLKSIANNAEIDVIWDKWQATLEPLREKLNATLKKSWQEWEIPRDAEDPWPADCRSAFYELRTEQAKGEDAKPKKISDCLFLINKNLKRSFTAESLPERPADPWPEQPTKLHADWWQARIARQKEIDASIAAKAEFEYLYDKPYDDKKKVRVAGPFTVESLSPHRMLGVDENDDLIDPLTLARRASEGLSENQSFAQMILENLKTAGVQQAHKEDRITFTALTAWPGQFVCGEGRYQEGESEKRAAIFIGPEFGTVQRADLVAAAREAGDAGFDVLIACAFNYEAHTTEFNKLGRIPVLKARMNADLHMADDLKNTGKGNLFVIFGEPDIDILPQKDGQLTVKVNGVDVFDPSSGEVRSDSAEGIACWFIDTDYNEESFFVRHAYFLGANDPYSALKTTLKAEINADAWATLHSDTSRPFDKPKSGRIAVKVINHLGDEVMKVFKL
jgi:adenine-specific DNA-methyltransferase